MKEKLEKIKESALEELESCNDKKVLGEIKVKYLGKQGELTSILRGMRDVSVEDRPKIGALVNDVRTAIEALVEEKEEKFNAEELNKKLESEKIDISLPSFMPKVGAPNILEHMIEEVEEIFMSMGYDVVDLCKSTMDEVMNHIDKLMYEDKTRYYKTHAQRNRRRDEENT